MQKCLYCKGRGFFFHASDTCRCKCCKGIGDVADREFEASLKKLDEADSECPQCAGEKTVANDDKICVCDLCNGFGCVSRETKENYLQQVEDGPIDNDE